MAETSKNKIYYNNDENSIADILADMKKLAESADNAIETKVDKDSGKKLSTNDFTNEYKNKLDELNNYDDTKIKEELEEVKEENTRLKEDLNALPTVSGRGEYVTLDTAECRFKNFSVEGKSEQETRSGKNKFNLNYIEQSTSKVVTDTGVNLINCWGTQTFNNEKVLKTFKPNTTYTMKAKAKVVSRPSTQGEHQTSTLLLYRAGSSALGLVSVDLIKMKDKETIALNTEKEYVMTFTTPADLSEVRLLTYSFYGNNDGSTTYAPSGEIDLTDIMLVEGTYTMDNFPSYEPYGVSPSPEYPSEIRNVGDNINLFNNNKVTSMVKLSYSNGIYTASDKDTKENLQYKIQQYDSSDKFVSGTSVTLNIDSTGTYYFTSKKKDGATRLRIANNGAKNEFVLKYPLDDIKVGEDFTVSINIIDITVGSSKFKDVMLVKGLIEKTYTPYGQGSINIKIQDENLFDKEKSKLKTRVSTTNGTFSTGFDYINCSDYINIRGIKKIYIGGNNTSQKQTDNYLAFFDNDKNFISGITGSNSGIMHNKSYDIPNNACYVVFNYQKDDINEVYLVQGTTEKTYVEHKEQNISFNLDKPLYQNCYLAEDGIHYTKKQIVLDGSKDEGWSLSATNTSNQNRFTSKIIENEVKRPSNADEIANIICSHFIKESANETYRRSDGIAIHSNGSICLYYDMFKEYTINEFKTWLSNNPITLEYELATEIIEPYTEEQKQQWEQLKNARSYEGQTHILSTDEISPDFNITARANLSEILNKLQGE